MVLLLALGSLVSGRFQDFLYGELWEGLETISFGVVVEIRWIVSIILAYDVVGLGKVSCYSQPPNPSFLRYSLFPYCHRQIRFI